MCEVTIEWLEHDALGADVASVSTFVKWEEPKETSTSNTLGWIKSARMAINLTQIESN